MSDRMRPQLPVEEPGSQIVNRDDAPLGSPGLGDLLRSVFQQVSNQIAGDDRYPLEPLSDIASELEVEPYLPSDQAVDPDFLWPTDDAEDFTIPVDVTGSVPTGTPPSSFFDPSNLPEPTQGRILKNSKGYLVYTTGIGEAPDNKANTNLPAYRRRADFMSEMYAWTQENFDVSGAGQHRDHDAEVTANRSANSDHYSDGAFDVRANSPQEALRVLAWASTQPWVSFAQVYPDGSLIHISANIAHFTEGGMPTPTQPPTTEPAPTPAPPVSPAAPPPIYEGRPS